MGDRLKQIWAGFEGQTERRLTGKGVDNIIVPARADYTADMEAILPDGMQSPAERAFAALREDLAAKDRKFSKKADRRAQRGPAPMTPAQTPPSAHYMGEDLMRGLRSTAMRVERAELDYGAYLNTEDGKKALKRAKKKKRFGIF